MRNEMDSEMKLVFYEYCQFLFQACTQFNLLAAEGRMVAAALVPPRSMKWREDDIYQTLNFDNKLFTIDTLHTPGLRDALPSMKKKPISKPEGDL